MLGRTTIAIGVIPSLIVLCTLLFLLLLFGVQLITGRQRILLVIHLRRANLVIGRQPAALSVVSNHGRIGRLLVGTRRGCSGSRQGLHYRPFLGRPKSRIRLFPRAVKR